MGHTCVRHRGGHWVPWGVAVPCYNFLFYKGILEGYVYGTFKGLLTLACPPPNPLI